MEIISTSDGSHTLFSPQYNQMYHSKYGAIQESVHVFIRNGLCNYIEAHAEIKAGKKPVRIFEAGFGTGLNALLTYIEASKIGLKIQYETIELYPVSIEIVKDLNYTQILGVQPPFHSMHLCTWGELHDITPAFKFKKIRASLMDWPAECAMYDVIYFDAFSPESQPEMWTTDIFKKMYDILIHGGVLVSYCSKGAFQRVLKAVGFKVEKLPGPPGKREMIRATK